MRLTEIEIDNRSGGFQLKSQRDGLPIEISIEGDEVSMLVNGEAPSVEQAERLRLDHAGAQRLRYYVYLYGLPMKILDPGAFLRAEVMESELDGQPSHQVKVTYDPTVGSDTW